MHALLMLLQAGRQVDTDTPCCFLNPGKAAGLSLGDIEKNVTFVSQWGFIHSATEKINKTKLRVGCSSVVRCLSHGHGSPWICPRME